MYKNNNNNINKIIISIKIVVNIIIITVITMILERENTTQHFENMKQFDTISKNTKKNVQMRERERET